MTKILIIAITIIFVSCQTNPQTTSNDILKLIIEDCGNGDTLKSLNNDSTFRLCITPLVVNLTNDTITFIKDIYGRSNRPELVSVFPKYGINIYKDGRKIEYEIERTCGNYGSLDEDKFVTINPYDSILPLFGSNSRHPFLSSYTIPLKIKEKGIIEIELYYNSLDTSQQFYHPFSDKEMRSNLAKEEYTNCRKLFMKLAHVDIKSNKIRKVLE
jgi:hypothetical protein